MGKRRERPHSAQRPRARDRPQGTANTRISAMTAQQAAARGAVLAPMVSSTRTAYDLATSETIYAAVSRIANALATMPLHLYRGTERMADDPRDVMVGLRPNRMMSAFAFKRAMEAHRNTEGRAYAVKRFDASGRLCELAVVDPRRVTPLIDEASGELWYRILPERAPEEYLHSWYVVALTHMSTNGVDAIRVTDVLAGTLKYSEDVKTFSLEGLKSVSQAIVLSYPRELAADRRERSVRETLDIYRKVGGKIIALDAGVTASQLGGSAIDPKAFDVEQVTRSRVATVYGIPPHLLGVWSDAAAGGTSEQQSIEFLTLTMMPIVTQWQEELDYKLLTPAERAAGYAFRFDPEAYLRADSMTMANVRQSQVRCGSRTINELRAADNLPPVEGGDVPFVSKDLAPVTLVARGGTIDIDAINGDHNSAN